MKDERILISVDELIALKKALRKRTDVDVPTQALAVIRISPSPIFILHKDYPSIRLEHTISRKRARKGDANGSILHFVTLSGGFFTEAEAQRVLELYGMRLIRIDFHFRPKPDILYMYDWKENVKDFPRPNKGEEFVYRREVDYKRNPLENLNDIEEDGALSPDNNKTDEVSTEEGGLKYDRILQTSKKLGLELYKWNRFFTRAFGCDGFTSEIKYIYTCSRYRNQLTPELEAEFYDNIGEYLSSPDVTLSKDGRSIGVEFDWKTEVFDRIITRLCTENPYVNFDIFPNHRCKVDSKVADLYFEAIGSPIKERGEYSSFTSYDTMQEWSGE